MATHSSILAWRIPWTKKSAGLQSIELQTVKYNWVTAAAAAAKSLQLCLTLCDPIDGSLPGSPVPGILQARTLEWVAFSFCWHDYSCCIWMIWVLVRFPGSAAAAVKSPQLCPTLCDPIDGSPPGSPVPGIPQARTLEWVKRRLGLFFLSALIVLNYQQSSYSKIAFQWLYFLCNFLF